MYSTTISKTVNTKPTAVTNFKEEKFLIKTDGIKPVSSPTPRPRTSFLDKSPSPPRSAPIASSTPYSKFGSGKLN